MEEWRNRANAEAEGEKKIEQGEGTTIIYSSIWAIVLSSYTAWRRRGVTGFFCMHESCMSGIKERGWPI